MANSADARLQALSTWLRADLQRPVDAIRPASSDASFRRYFRAWIDGDTFILMDAPPPQEDVRPFIHISRLLRQVGIQAPQIHAQDVERGFLLLDDFGNTCYLDKLDADSADALYGDAMASLERLQGEVNVANCGLPPYDESLLRTEMNLFGDWFIRRLLGFEPVGAEAAVLEKTWTLLVRSALEQPRVCVHRDYHSRNLMVTERDNPGILDFQDAVIGPITYDLVSLLRDCYIAWPHSRVDAWVGDYHLRLVDQGLAEHGDADRFMRWFDLMGVQRHLKAIGIFSRLKLRDGKSGYLGDIPRTLSYVTSVCERYPDLADFLRFLQDRVQDRATATLGQAA
jgi:aminoglycoside/choline kinase family phosphotransferase